jgi:rubredoxin/mono/diheme cytochrome c family protein
MARYECSICGYIYDEAEEGAPWDGLPDDWTCPVCDAAKSDFEALDEDLPPSDEAEEVESKEAAPAPPSRAAVAHRVCGYLFLALYVLLIVQMVPRLWSYQIEFPARTVVHISLGMAIGVVLILKIAVVRFFRRLDQSLLPSLGTFLLVGSVVLIGISVPSAFREALATGQLFEEDNRQRVSRLLAQTGLPEEQCTRLATSDSLRTGQRILRQECIGCHDLRTVLAKPRTPSSWRQTVARMADRTTMLDPLEENEQRQVTAYLVALSPDLRKSAQQRRQEQDRLERSNELAQTVAAELAGPTAYDSTTAKQLFEAKCSQCHEATLVDESSPGSEDEARQLVAWMVQEGLEATEDELAQIVQYLTEVYVKASE